MSEEPVLVHEQRGAVSVLRLNRPDARNALNAELLGAIGQGLADAEQDTDTQAIRALNAKIRELEIE